MKLRLTIIILVLVLLASLAVSVSADIGTILWKMHCPDGASVMTYPDVSGGVDIVCMNVLRPANK
jgi:hypothetical protein